MYESMMAALIVPLMVGASVGSLYFTASHYARYESKWVLSSMIVTSWVLGYSAGLPVSELPSAIFISLLSSAVGVITLDAINSSTIDGKELPPIVNWLTRVIESIRGGKR